MAQATLDRILNELQSLEWDDLQQVEEAIRARRWHDVKEAEGEEQFRRALVASGLVAQYKPGLPVYDDVPLIEIEGKPLSQTIIEERR
jgi:hypothetical protein